MKRFHIWIVQGNQISEDLGILPGDDLADALGRYFAERLTFDQRAKMKNVSVAKFIKDYIRWEEV